MTGFFLPSAAYARRDGAAKRLSKPKRKSPERDFQVALVKILRKHATTLFWSVPNGGYRHLFTATKLRAEGQRPGVPDLHFLLLGGKAAFLELKAKTGSLSKEQKEFRDAALQAGALWASAKTLDEALEILSGWGVVAFNLGGKV